MGGWDIVIVFGMYDENRSLGFLSPGIVLSIHGTEKPSYVLTIKCSLDIQVSRKNLTSKSTPTEN